MVSSNTILERNEYLKLISFDEMNDILSKDSIDYTVADMQKLLYSHYNCVMYINHYLYEDELTHIIMRFDKDIVKATNTVKAVVEKLSEIIKDNSMAYTVLKSVVTSESTLFGLMNICMSNPLGKESDCIMMYAIKENIAKTFDIINLVLNLSDEVINDLYTHISDGSELRTRLAYGQAITSEYLIDYVSEL